MGQPIHQFPHSDEFANNFAIFSWIKSQNMIASKLVSSNNRNEKIPDLQFLTDNNKPTEINHAGRQ